MVNKALVVLSGGQDSTTVLFAAMQDFDEIHAVTFDYGQTHRIEIEAATKIVAIAQSYRKVTHEVITLGPILQSTSPLTNKSVELEKYENAEQMDKVIGNRREKTFVPMRNALFLTIAANRAEALGIKDIFLGVCQMDNANYDDCRQVFIDAAEDYINKALGHDHRGVEPVGLALSAENIGLLYHSPNRVLLHAPLMNLSKAETVKAARNLPGCWDALAYSHTSYDGKYPPTDMNHANVLRADGFEKAGLPDPLVLRAWNEGLMELPASGNYAQYRGLLPSHLR